MENQKQPDIIENFILLLGAVVIYIVALFIIAYPVQWIWNSTVVKTFHVESLEYIEVVRLLIFVRLILPGKGFGDKNASK
jgi:hypothetical protein